MILIYIVICDIIIYDDIFESKIIYIYVIYL